MQNQCKNFDRKKIPKTLTLPSLPEVLCIKCVLKNFLKIHRKTLVLESLFNKDAVVTLLKSDSSTGVFLQKQVFTYLLQIEAVVRRCFSK